MAKEKTHKTSKADFHVFKKEAEYWIDRFHLREWKITILHQDHPFESLKNMNLAWCDCQFKDRICHIGLAPDWGLYDPVTLYEVSKSGFHEVAELLFANLALAADADAAPTTKGQNMADIHSIIRRLEWSVWEPDWNSRQKK